MAYAVACRALTVSALELHAPNQPAAAAQTPPPPPQAEVYFINMDERVDKCRCMKSQLKDSPWPTHRFSAVSSVNVNDTCPTVMAKILQRPDMKGEALALRTAAKLCSNVKVWERFMETSEAKHLVVFEDDTIINGTGLWDTVGSFFEADCSNWDYLMIDSWRNGVDEAVYPSFDPSLGCDRSDMNRLNFHFSGSHMQVISRRTVQILLEWIHMRRTRITMIDKLAALAATRFRPHLQAWQVSLNLTSEARFVPELAGEKCFNSVWEIEDRVPLEAPDRTALLESQWGWTC